METDLKQVSNTVLDKLKEWLNTAIELLPNIALAVVILIVGYLAAKFTSKYSEKYITKLSKNATIGSFLSKLLFILIFVLAGVLALSVMNLDKTISSILAGLGIVGLALGFAFQDTAANLMSGIYISFKQPFGLGDIIETTHGHMGKVIDINLRVTKVRLFDGPVVYVPNKYLFQDYFINYTITGKRRFRLECGVSYGDDLEKVERVAIEALESIPSRLKSEDVTIHWKEFGSSSINFSVNVWMEYDREQSDYITTRNESIKALKKAFDENDITIPFPIRTLDFGIKGGEHLREELGIFENHNSSE
jgi:small conductance mechanosensitive channel